jgi:hypothetical protein
VLAHQEDRQRGEGDIGAKTTCFIDKIKETKYRNGLSIFNNNMHRTSCDFAAPGDCVARK